MFYNSLFFPLRSVYIELHLQPVYVYSVASMTLDQKRKPSGVFVLTLVRRVTSVIAAIVIASSGAPNALAQSQSTTYEYDALGRLVRGIYPCAVNVTYAYDAAGNRTSLQTGTGANRPPNAASDVTSTNSNAPVLFDPRTNDCDPDGGALTVVSASTPSSGTATISGGGTGITYTPATNFVGTASFTYTVRDPQNATATAAVTVTIANRPPVAQADSVTTAFGTALTFDPRANDSDPESGQLTFDSLTTPTNGTAAIAGGNAGITFTPGLNFAGVATFGYTINDPFNASASATVTVNVSQKPNEPPVPGNDNASTPHNTAVFVNVLSNDYDPESDDLTVGSVSAPSSGTAAVAGGGQSVLYTPASGFSGVATFNYVVSDSEGNSATGNVSVAVAPLANQPPVAQNCTAYAMLDNPGDTYYYGQINPVCAYDPDPGDTIQLNSVSGSPYASIVPTGGGNGYLRYAGPIGTGYVALYFTVRDALGAVSNTGQIDVYFVE